MRNRILLAASLVYLCAANIIWIAIDTRPPFWDMANHASWALDVLRDFQQNGLAAFLSLPRISGNYPPLYYAITALFYSLLGTTIDTAQLANLPAIILLGLATYGIARTVLDPTPAALAGILVNFFPFMLWISRETLLEYWLTALVAASIWVLLRTHDFSNPRWSLIFGIVCGLGLLTKWTFPLFVVPPALWAARRNWRNALMAAAAATVIASYWYLPQFPALRSAWELAASGGQSEGDPSSFSLEGWLFYFRALEGYQLFLPLFLVFVAGLVVLVRKRRTLPPQWTTLALFLVGGWLGLMLLPNKDPRYSAPLLPAAAVVIAAAFGGTKRQRTLRAALPAFLLFQHVVVSFGIPSLPERIVLAKGPAGPVPYDWNLYTQTYFGLWGPPEDQDWQIEHVLEVVTADAVQRDHPVRLGLVPDLPRFDLQAFRFYIGLNKLPVVIERVFAAEEAAILRNDYVLMSLGTQTAFGSPAPHAAEINAYVLFHPDQFRMIDRFSLPNGEAIRLYHRAR